MLNSLIIILTRHVTQPKKITEHVPICLALIDFATVYTLNANYTPWGVIKSQIVKQIKHILFRFVVKQWIWMSAAWCV